MATITDKKRLVVLQNLILILMHIIEEILRITARLQSRKFGQALILLQVLSSHPHVFIMFLCESMNFHPNKQLFPSCRRMGSNSWPLDYKSSTLPLHHWGPTTHWSYPPILLESLVLKHIASSVSSSVKSGE